MDTQDESTDPTAQSTDPRTKAAKPARSLLSPVRIFLFVLLAIMIGAWVVDHRAREASQAAYDTLDKALGPESGRSSATREEVHRLVGRDPDDDGNPDDAAEQYSWQGVPYKHTVHVGYWPGKDSTMKDVQKSNELP
jgi:hypothetical protein